MPPSFWGTASDYTRQLIFLPAQGQNQGLSHIFSSLFPFRSFLLYFNSIWTYFLFSDKVYYWVIQKKIGITSIYWANFVLYRVGEIHKCLRNKLHLTFYSLNPLLKDRGREEKKEKEGEGEEEWNERGEQEQEREKEYENENTVLTSRSKSENGKDFRLVKWAGSY